MTSRVETVGGCQVLRATGRIDFESAADFEQSVNSILQSGGDRLIIELSEVDLLSSAGLRVLLSAAKKASHREVKFALAAPSLVVRQVFEISHFNLLFKIYSSVLEAVTALGGFQGRSEETSPPLVAAVAKPIAQKNPVTPPLISAPGTLPPDIPARAVAETAAPPAEPVKKPAPPEGVEAVVSEKTLEVKSARENVEAGAATVVPAAAAVSKQTLAPRLPSQRNSEPPPVPPTAPPIPVADPSPQAEHGPRREAPFPSSLEVRVEGVSYACKDGDVIGKGGQIARSFFDQIPALEPRHLLIGQTDGRWFIFTPKTVVHPFSFDGVILSAGERKPLVHAEHQMEIGGQIFGLRLVPIRKSPGFFARLFGKR